MAVLIWDGFDDYTTAQLSSHWDTVGPATTITANGRSGGGALTSDYQNGNLSTKNLPAGVRTIIFGFAVSRTAGFAGNAAASPALSLFESTGGVRHFGMGINVSNQLQVYRGTTLVGTSSAPASNTGYTYIEGRVTVGTADGSIELRSNGTQILLLNNINTRNGGTNGWIDRFQIYPGFALGSNKTYIDDLYVLDTSGDSYNTFLGDTRIVNGAPPPSTSVKRPQIFVCT